MKKVRNCHLAGCALAVMITAVAFFTFFPPQIGLFEDPPTGGYGITDPLIIP